MLLDETGQPFHTELLKRYLAAPHLQDFQGIHLWQEPHQFSKELARAYEKCLAACQREEIKTHEILPLLCVRLLRAAAEQMKLELIRYINVESAVWERMFRGYSIAETSQFTGTMIFAYPGYALHTSPQHELLRALVLHESSPATLAPDQVEVAFRIAGRMASYFDFTTTPNTASEYYIDLTQPHAPKLLDNTAAATPGTRYFSALRALPMIIEIIKQHEHTAFVEERRFGSEFTPEGKLTVLKHLLVYWNKHHPYRLQQRRGISTNIEVVHGFRSISKLVTCINLDRVTGLSKKDATLLRVRGGHSVPNEGEASYPSEIWTVVDASVNGIGGMIPKSAGSWVKIGDLCGLKAQNTPLWWISVIRRLHADSQGIMHVGIEILAKKSLSVWLRTLGNGAQMSDGKLSSSSFQYDYFPAILLPDEHNSYMKGTLLLESGSYVPCKIYEVLLGEKNREIELTGLLAEGEDYEWVTFRWLIAASERWQSQH
jgi:hypothetical protein